MMNAGIENHFILLVLRGHSALNCVSAWIQYNSKWPRPRGLISALSWKPDTNDLTLYYTVIIYYYVLPKKKKKKTQWNESQMAADWKTRNIHLIFRCIFPCADTPSHVLTLPAAHSHNIAGEIWSTKLDHKCSGALRKAGIILFWLQNMDMALGLQTTVGKRTDYNIKIEHNVKVSTQNYMLRF